MRKRKRAGGKATASYSNLAPDAVTTPARGDDHRGLLSGPTSSSCRGFVFPAGVARLRKRLAARPSTRSTRARCPRQRVDVPPPPSRAPLPASPPPSGLQSPGAEPRMLSWRLLPPIARLGAPFALLASLPYLLRRETRKGLRAPYLFLSCKPLGLNCV